MKAAVLKEIGKPIVMEDVPEPTIESHEVLVQTKACGICGTDLHISDGWGYVPDLPFVMGHEPSGVVAKIGEKVTRFKVGDRVITNNFYTCGHCLYCRTNRETQCENLEGILGVLNHWGGYGEYFSIPERQLFHLPDSINFAEGSVIADAVVTAYHAVERGRVSQGEQVAIIGAGGCGLAAAQICKFSGATVYGVDISEEKISNMKRYGLDGAINSKKEDAPFLLKELTDGFGVLCVIDTVGNEESLTLALNSVRRGGRVVILGYTQERYPLDPRQMAVYELEIIGTRSGGRQCTVEAIKAVANPRWVPIVSDIFPIEQVNEALDKLRSGNALGRIVLSHES